MVDGAEIESHAGKLQVVVGAFTRGPAGDVPSTDKSWDLYLRLRRPIVGNLLAGATGREADEDVLGGDLVWQSKRVLLAGEYVRSEDADAIF